MWNKWQLEERRKIIPRKEGVRTAAANELRECGHVLKSRKNRIVGTLTNFFPVGCLVDRSVRNSGVRNSGVRNSGVRNSGVRNSEVLLCIYIMTE